MFKTSGALLREICKDELRLKEDPSLAGLVVEKRIAYLRRIFDRSADALNDVWSGAHSVALDDQEYNLVKEIISLEKDTRDFSELLSHALKSAYKGNFDASLLTLGSKRSLERRNIREARRRLRARSSIENIIDAIEHYKNHINSNQPEKECRSAVHLLTLRSIELIDALDDEIDGQRRAILQDIRIWKDAERSRLQLRLSKRMNSFGNRAARSIRAAAAAVMLAAIFSISTGSANAQERRSTGSKDARELLLKYQKQIEVLEELNGEVGELVRKEEIKAAERMIGLDAGTFSDAIDAGENLPNEAEESINAHRKLRMKLEKENQKVKARIAIKAGQDYLKLSLLQRFETGLTVTTDKVFRSNGIKILKINGESVIEGINGVYVRLSGIITDDPSELFIDANGDKINLATLDLKVKIKFRDLIKNIDKTMGTVLDEGLKSRGLAAKSFSNANGIDDRMKINERMRPIARHINDSISSW